jgi:hypothetical protein
MGRLIKQPRAGRNIGTPSQSHPWDGKSPRAQDSSRAGRKAATWAQLDRLISMMIELQLASKMPLVFGVRALWIT